ASLPHGDLTGLLRPRRVALLRIDDTCGDREHQHPHAEPTNQMHHRPPLRQPTAPPVWTMMPHGRTCEASVGIEPFAHPLESLAVLRRVAVIALNHEGADCHGGERNQQGAPPRQTVGHATYR